MRTKKKQSEKVALFCKLNTSLAKRLDEYCEQTGISKTAAVEKALTAYLNASTFYSPVARDLDVASDDKEL